VLYVRRSDQSKAVGVTLTHQPFDPADDFELTRTVSVNNGSFIERESFASEFCTIFLEIPRVAITKQIAVTKEIQTNAVTQHQKKNLTHVSLFYNNLNSKFRRVLHPL
jgi:hypothetical protein